MAVPTPAPGRKRRLLARADRAASILRAAARAFARAGYAGTSMDDIATAAGVSKLMLYRHFNSKHSRAGYWTNPRRADRTIISYQAFDTKTNFVLAY